MSEHQPYGRSVGFVSGPAVGIVGPRAIALVDDDPRSSVVKDLCSVVAAGGEFAELTQVLISHGLVTLPSLVIAHLDPTGVRALVRGTMVLTLQKSGEAVGTVVEAPNVTTWIEHVEPDVEHVALHARGDLAELGFFRITGGVIPAVRLEADLVEARPSAVANPFGDIATDVARADVPVAGRTEDEASPQESIGVWPPTGIDPQPSTVAVEPTTTAEPTGYDADEESANEESADPDGPGTDEHVPHRDLANVTVRFEEEAFTAEPSPPPHSPPIGPTPSIAQPPPLPVGEPGDNSDGSDEGADDFDHLFGATQFRPVSSAGVKDDADEDVTGAEAAAPAEMISSLPPTVGNAPTEADDLGDHDGTTISLSQLRAAQAGAAGPSVKASAPSTIASMVHAVVCPAGHHNPPAATSCRRCGVEIPEQAHVSVPRPVLGRFRFSTGEERPVTRPMLLGRSPKAEGALGGELPELVSLPSPTKELSGTHLEVRIEGWQVIVVDRRSTNGTTVHLPQRDPQRLHPGEPFPIVPGTVVDLADEIQFTYEVGP